MNLTGSFHYALHFRAGSITLYCASSGNMAIKFEVHSSVYSFSNANKTWAVYPWQLSMVKIILVLSTVKQKGKPGQLNSRRHWINESDLFRVQGIRKGQKQKKEMRSVCCLEMSHVFCLSPGDKVRSRWNMTMISNTETLFLEQGERMCGVKTLSQAHAHTHTHTDSQPYSTHAIMHTQWKKRQS